MTGDRLDRSADSVLRQSHESRTDTKARGSVHPRQIFGVFVLLLIADPLVTLAADLQTRLSTSASISDLTAGAIAGLIIVGMALAILEIET